MNDWKDSLIREQATIRDAIETIDESSFQVAIVTDEKLKLLGIITDRDVRRGVLKGIPLSESIDHIINRNPRVASENDDKKKRLAILKKTKFRHLPIVNPDGVLTGVEILDSIKDASRQDVSIVIMAGGTGSRLQTLTRDCPKPLLKVGDKPILETILNNFTSYGYSKFYISVNYKADMIEDYFGDGHDFDAEIEYLRESEKLGTAGALTLLPHKPTHPVIVMNADLLTKINFKHLLDFHIHQDVYGTMCVRKYDFQVPYGVVQIKDQNIVRIDEKPVHQFFVNAGIYVLQPEVLALIPRDTYFDMTELFDKIIEKRYSTTVFPVREYWLDIGQTDDFKRANGDFKKVFK